MKLFNWLQVGWLAVLFWGAGAEAQTSLTSPLDTGGGALVPVSTSGSGFLQRSTTSQPTVYYGTVVMADPGPGLDPALNTVAYSDPLISPSHCVDMSSSSGWIYLNSGNGNANVRGPYAIVPNAGDNTVSVYDTQNNKEVGKIAVGSYPYGVAVSRVGRYAYVANRDSHTVSVIDVQRLAVTATLNVGANPTGIALNGAEDRLYVAHAADHTLSIIDVVSHDVLRTIPVGQQPHEVLVSPADEAVYVFNRADATVSRLDPHTYAVTTAPVTLASDGEHLIPGQMVLDHAGKSLYVTLTDANGATLILVAVDTSSLTPRLVLPLDGTPSALTLSLDDATAYLALDKPVCGELVKVVLGANPSVTQTATVERGINSLMLAENSRFYAINGMTNALGEYFTLDLQLTHGVVLGDTPQALGDFVGIKLPPAVTIEPEQLDFGVVVKGQSVERTLDLLNNGFEAFTLQSAEIVRWGGLSCTLWDGSPCPAVDPKIIIVENTCLNTAIAPGQRCSMTLSYSASSIYVNSMYLVFTTDQELGQRRVAITATVYDDIQFFQVPTSAENIGTTEVGDNTNATINSEADGGGGMLSYAELLLLVFGASAPRVINLASAQLGPRRG